MPTLPKQLNIRNLTKREDARIAKRKSASAETLEVKEVVTSDTQDQEPVKWTERKRDETVHAGDEVRYVGVWQSASHELGKQAVGVLGDYSCPSATRYITLEWKAWKARQDSKESNKEPVAPVEAIPTNSSESVKLSNKSDMLAALEDASRELHFLHNCSLAAEMIADKCDAAIAKAKGGAK